MNSNFDGFNGLYGPGPCAVLAEMGRQRNKAAETRNGAQYEAQAWLWQHKLLLFVIGALMLTLLIVSGNGV